MTRRFPHSPGVIFTLLSLSACTGREAPLAATPNASPSPVVENAATATFVPATPTATLTPSPTPGPGLPELLLTPRADYANAQLDAAREAYRALAESYPASAEPYIGLAEIAAREGDPGAEIEALRAGVEAQPNSLEALRKLAVALQAAGESEELAGVYIQIAALTPEDPAPLLASALLLAAQGDSIAAIESLGRYAARQPSRAEAAWIDAAGAAYGARYYEASSAIAGAGLAIESDASSLYFARAMSSLALGDDAAALADLDQALSLRPVYVEAALWRGRVRVSAGDLAGARADFALAAVQGLRSGLRDEELAFEAMAEEAALLAATDANAAFNLLAAYVISHGSRDALLLGYARVEWARGSRERAIERLAGLVSADYAPALYWRGLYSSELGKPAEAQADLEAFLLLLNYGPYAENARRLLGQG